MSDASVTVQEAQAEIDGTKVAEILRDFQHNFRGVYPDYVLARGVGPEQAMIGLAIKRGHLLTIALSDARVGAALLEAAGIATDVVYGRTQMDDAPELIAALAPDATAALETVTSHDDHQSCDVCGRHFQIDTVVSHELWESIKPDPNSAQGCGMLCAGCMADKISKVTDWSAIRMANIALEPTAPPYVAQAVRVLIPVLVAKHDAYMRGKNRNPADYASKYIGAANTLRALLPEGGVE